MELNKIYQGDVIEVLKTFPNESVDCIITSPPYYGLRDYGVEGQVGLEPTLNEYLDKMLLVTGELKRVLKKTGSMWWNHGDSYSGNSSYDPNGRQRYEGTKEANMAEYLGGKNYRNNGHKVKNTGGNIPEKSLLLQAHRLAIRMVDEQGWILRNQIIWHKSNCMPSSVEDRFTVDFEPIFFFSKSKKYYFEPQYEPHRSSENEIKRQYSDGEKESEYATNKKYSGGVGYGELGRNKRTVWKIPTQPYSEAHFATFPKKLVEIPIKAGCPEFVCKKCGKAREKIFEVEYSKPRGNSIIGSKKGNDKNQWSGSPVLNKYPVEIGYTDCGCNAGFDAGVVLDPFFGSGTTGWVAQYLGRKWVGIELSPEYIKIAEQRFKQEMLF